MSKTIKYIIIKEAVSSFLNDAEITKSPNTYTSYHYSIQHFIDFSELDENKKTMTTSQITKEYCENYIIYLYKLNKENSKSTFNNKYNAFRAMIHYFAENNLIHEDIYKYINSKRIGNKTMDEKRVRKDKYIDSDTVLKIKKRVMLYGENDATEVKILFALLRLGFRRGSILTLRFSDVDLKKNCLCTVGKGNSVVKISLTTELIDLFKTLCKKRGIYDKNEFIFKGNSELGTWSISRFNRRIEIICHDLTDTQNNKITAHSFRHTFCTNGIYEKKNLKILQMYTGHRDVNTLLSYVRTYTTVEESNKISL